MKQIAAQTEHGTYTFPQNKLEGDDSWKAKRLTLELFMYSIYRDVCPIVNAQSVLINKKELHFVPSQGVSGKLRMALKKE